MGDEVDLCVPTGNFGNILAGWYARAHGPARPAAVLRLEQEQHPDRFLPDRRLRHCAATSTGPRRRRWTSSSPPTWNGSYSTSPGGEGAGADQAAVLGWFDELRRTGAVRGRRGHCGRTMARVVVPGWVDEPRVFADNQPRLPRRRATSSTPTRRWPWRSARTRWPRTAGWGRRPARHRRLDGHARSSSPGDVLAAITGERPSRRVRGHRAAARGRRASPSIGPCAACGSAKSSTRRLTISRGARSRHRIR
ncbi:MAG: hypothetical protein MZV63_64420 [Marinilabiliales bacterium]|nr:hypothetical protein [Marinilabiliales bacterium]